MSAPPTDCEPAWPTALERLASRLVPWSAWGALALAAAAMATSLLLAPAEGTRGDAWRIGFLHIPAAWMSLVLYAVMAAAAAVSLARPRSPAALLMGAVAPTGALFALLALWSGSLWVGAVGGLASLWDARLICVVLLLLLFGAVMLMSRNASHGCRLCAVLVLVGMLNIPMVYASLQWWHALHPGVNPATTAPMARPVLAGMSMMTFAFLLYAFAAVLGRVRLALGGAALTATGVPHGDFQ